MRTVSDIDVLYVLPSQMRADFARRVGNVQSQILQEVRKALLPSYPNTIIRADGPTVIVDLLSTKIEIAPVFFNSGVDRPSARYAVCQTKDNGSYTSCAPYAEEIDAAQKNANLKGELVHLIKMLKVWRKIRNVPIKSIVLEMLASEFLASWENVGKGWYDWMLRDFYLFMATHRSPILDGVGFMPGTGEIIFYGSAWKVAANTAYTIAVKACVHEDENRNQSAGEEWQRIFGNLIPMVA